MLLRIQRRGTRPQAGLTLLELIIACSILIILASAALPVTRVTIRRQKEIELHRALREIRSAIDRYKDTADRNLIQVEVGTEGYPPDLDTLVEGIGAANDASGRMLKYLRRIPIDPMTSSQDWGKRAYQDDPDTTAWGGKNVFDVYTKSTGTALDGTKYRDW